MFDPTIKKQGLWVIDSDGTISTQAAEEAKALKGTYNPNLVIPISTAPEMNLRTLYDNSVQKIKQYIRDDKRFKLIQLSKNSGPAVARNAGLDAAQGKYIAFLDSDDCYTDTTIELLIQLIETTGADMAGGRAHTVNPEFKFKQNSKAMFSIENFAISHNPERFLLLPKNNAWVWIWRRIYKRELIGNTRFLTQYTTFGDDLTFMLDISYRAKTTAECSNICVYHRLHDQNITTKPFNETNFTWFCI